MDYLLNRQRISQIPWFKGKKKPPAKYSEIFRVRIRASLARSNVAKIN